MPKALLIIRDETIRARAIEWIKRVPIGWRVIIDEQKRSTEQSDLMWTLLGFVAAQARLRGDKYDMDSWKCIFMKALGHEIKMLPQLHGGGYFPNGTSSRKLNKTEMTDLIEFIYAEGAAMGVNFHNERSIAA